MSLLHPSDRALEEFVLGGLELPENHRIVRHLLTGCARCRGVTTGVWERLEQGLRAATRAGRTQESVWGASGYRAVIDRAVRAAVGRVDQRERDRARGAVLLDELRKHPVPRQLTLVRNSRRFRSWALTELLMAESFASRFDDPQRSLGLAEVALAAARRVPESEYGRPLLNDLQGRAWSYLGNARRVASDLQGAQAAFTKARERLHRGTGDPVERALLLRFRAHLEVARRRFEPAFGLYDQARQLYRRCGEASAETAVVLDKGFAYATAGRQDLAVPMLEEGLRRIDWRQEPRRVLAARHNLVDCLNETGRHAEALQQLEQLRPAYRELGDRMNLLRLRWLEGKVLSDLGRTLESEAALSEARMGFVERGVGYEAALVALDMAALYIQTGRAHRVRRLAVEILPVFESRRVERETLAALVAFERAARIEQVTVGMVRQLAERIRRGRGG